MVIAADWRSTATVARWRLSPWKWWEASYRLTEIVRLDGFGDDELYALREGRSLAEDEGMEKVHWTSGAQDLGRTLSEDPPAPNAMGYVTICTSPRAVGQKRVTNEFGWTSAAARRSSVPGFNGPILDSNRIRTPCPPAPSSRTRLKLKAGRFMKTNPCDERVGPSPRSITSNTPSNSTRLQSRPPGCPAIPLNAVPLPSRLRTINALLPLHPLSTHPFYSLTPRQGRSITPILPQTAPPTLLQPEMRTEMPGAMGTFLAVMLSYTPELPGFTFRCNL